MWATPLPTVAARNEALTRSATFMSYTRSNPRSAKIHLPLPLGLEAPQLMRGWAKASALTRTWHASLTLRGVMENHSISGRSQRIDRTYSDIRSDPMMTGTELNKYRMILNAKEIELARAIGKRDGIAIERTPDALDEV